MTLDHHRRRTVTALAAIALLPAIRHAFAQGQPPAAPFRVVQPPHPVDGAKIEVLEFFQYGCPHCYSFSPDLESWRKKQTDIDYKRVHINWNNETLPHTKLYYTLEQMGRIADVHDKVFAAIHTNKKKLLDTNEIADLMAANGIDRKKWLDSFNSFSVATSANRATQTWRAYRIDGTPAVAVDGKFITAPSMVGSREATLTVMDSLLKRARTERKK